jgi:hypothetical protein
MGYNVYVITRALMRAGWDVESAWQAANVFVYGRLPLQSSGAVQALLNAVRSVTPLPLQTENSIKAEYQRLKRSKRTE